MRYQLGVLAAACGMCVGFGTALAQTLRTTLYAANCPTKSDWENESAAEGAPDSSGQDGRYAQVIRGLSTTQELTNSAWRTSSGASYSLDEARYRISAVYVNAKCRFDTSSSGNRITLRAYDSVTSTSRDSSTWSQGSGDSAMVWRFSGDGWNITSLRSSWTASSVRDLDLAVRRDAGSTQLRVDALRLIVEAVRIDSDGDGVTDVDDNCPTVFNPNQADWNADGQGDVCDDSDSDTITDDRDNCRSTPNFSQRDTDGDGIGDECDDSDGDGIPDVRDNCRLTPNPFQEDTDGDRVGDACDNCRLGWNLDQRDTDGDGTGDRCEDDDLDSVPNYRDNCPTVSNPTQTDRDLDGTGDACDDSDGDGVVDASDNCWLNSNPTQVDTDRDGIGDACDACAVPNRRTDYDADGVDSACDPDEVVLMDPLGAANRPATYEPGYSDGTYSWTYGSTTFSGIGFGDVVGAGRRGSGSGSTGGGFGAYIRSHMNFVGDEPGDPFIQGTVSSETNPIFGPPSSGFAFNGLWMTFTVTQKTYYRYTRSSASASTLDRLDSSPFNSKLLLPGDYEIYIGSSRGPQDAAPQWCRIEFLKSDPCPCDITADGTVDDIDFQLFARAYDLVVVPSADPAADFNRDGTVDDADFSRFVQAYDIVWCN